MLEIHPRSMKELRMVASSMDSTCKELLGSLEEEMNKVTLRI